MGALTNPIHLAFIAMIALIFLGPKRLPELAKSIGNGMREFRETLSMTAETHEDAPPIAVAAAEAAPVVAPVAAVAAPVPLVIPPPHTPASRPEAS